MLKFECGVATVSCAHCNKNVRIEAKSVVAQTRLDHIFDIVMASIRTQGYHKGYLCRKCEPSQNVSTKKIRARCKRYFTPALFESRKGVQIKVT
jgi:hypothetical protein